MEVHRILAVENCLTLHFSIKWVPDSDSKDESLNSLSLGWPQETWYYSKNCTISLVVIDWTFVRHSNDHLNSRVG